MQTHKNPNLRAASVVPAKPTAATITAPKPFKPGTPAKKPPVFALQNKKWIVEYQEGKKDLVIDDTNRNQTVYMFKCNNTVLQVKGKINSVTLDGCTKSAIVVEDLVSTCEFVNCKSVQAQVSMHDLSLSLHPCVHIHVYVCVSMYVVNYNIFTKLEIFLVRAWPTNIVTKYRSHNV